MTEQIQNHKKEKELIQRNSTQLLQLINQLLELAKAEAGQAQLNYVQSDVMVYLKYLTESFQSLAWTQQRSLGIHVTPATLVMDYEPEKLQIIISNLLANAFKFTRQYGRIQLVAQRTATNQLQISIEDNGKGITAAELPHIFNRFYQADQSEQLTAAGTGIGLALVKELVEQMHGTIRVASEPEVKTIFTILLPISNQAALQATTTNEILAQLPILPPLAAATSELSDQMLPQLLIVEDNYDVITFLQSILQPHYQIRTANNGNEGLQQAQTHLPDLIISDVMMPEMDGFTFCTTLKSDVRTSHIPIILLTAKATQTDKLDGLQRGADAFLTKPFQKKELLIRLEQLLANRQRVQSFYAQHAQLPQYLPVENAFLKTVHQCIQDNLANENFSVEDLATAVHFNRVHLFRKLKGLIDKSPKQLITEIRMNKAKSLLQCTDHTIAEIARQVGYRDGGHFTKVYKKFFLELPTATRAK